MVYNCGYPIWHPISSQSQPYQDYSILIGADIVFTGRIYFKSTDAQIEQIDISPVAREYCDVLYETADFTNPGVYNLPTEGNTGSIITIIVTDDSGSTSYNVKYDYNTMYTQQSPDTGVLREPITLDVDPRQLLIVSGYSQGGSITYSAAGSNGSAASGSGASGAISGLVFDMASYAFSPGDTVDMTANGDTETYTVRRACKNNFAVYYVNKYGGMESLMCTGRYTESWNRDKTDVRLYNDRISPLDFEQQTINSDLDHLLTLNTGFVPKGRERYIDNLINTTKLWVHDFEIDLIYSAKISTSNFSHRQYEFNRPVSYEFTVVESQKQLRR